MSIAVAILLIELFRWILHPVGQLVECAAMVAGTLIVRMRRSALRFPEHQMNMYRAQPSEGSLSRA